MLNKLDFELFRSQHGPFTFLDLIGMIVVVLSVYIFSFILRKIVANNLRKRKNFDRTQILTYNKILHFITMILGILIAFRTAGFPLTSVLAGSAALLVGVGFGIQNIVNNFICGLIILFEKPFKMGEYVRIGTLEGKVVKISNRATQLLTLNDEIIVMPNAKMLEGPITNLSFQRSVRVASRFHVAFGTDLMKMKGLLLDIAKLHPLVVQEPKPDVFLDNFSENGIEVAFFVYVDQPEKYQKVLSDLNFAIEKAFKENNIVLPYPQRVVHVRQI
jgi:potassium efflux system protein